MHRRAVLLEAWRATPVARGHTLHLLHAQWGHRLPDLAPAPLAEGPCAAWRDPSVPTTVLHSGWRCPNADPAPLLVLLPDYLLNSTTVCGGPLSCGGPPMSHEKPRDDLQDDHHGAVFGRQAVSFFFLWKSVEWVAPLPLSVALQSPTVTLQPPSVTPQPASVTLQPPSVTLEPPPDTLPPPSATLQLPWLPFKGQWGA